MTLIGVKGSAPDIAGSVFAAAVPQRISRPNGRDFRAAAGAQLPKTNEAAVMRYVVTDDFVAKHGWTPDTMARALFKPLAQIGVHVERARGFGQGGFQSDGLTPEELRQKVAEVKRVLNEVLDGPPPDKPTDR